MAANTVEPLTPMQKLLNNADDLAVVLDYVCVVMDEERSAATRNSAATALMRKEELFFVISGCRDIFRITEALQRNVNTEAAEAFLVSNSN